MSLREPSRAISLSMVSEAGYGVEAPRTSSCVALGAGSWSIGMEEAPGFGVGGRMGH
jgi:hypothetical protein